MICQASGSAIATVPTATWPRVHSSSASAPVEVTIMALSIDRESPNSVLRPQRGMEQAGVLVERLAHIGVLLPGAGEQLDGQDIGVAVDHPPGDQRARLRHGLGAVAHARHEGAQQQQIAGEPEHDRQRQPAVGAGQQQQRAGAVHQDVPDGGQQRDQALADRRPGLHHPVGDAAGEIVLEERPALAHHVPMALPADQVRHIGGDRLVGHDVLAGQRQRPQHQQQPAPSRQGLARRSRTGARAGSR